jgi:predicted transcriptional regulator
MGTITINIDNDVEKQFRELAQKIYSKKKGYLGNAVTSAMQKWIDEATQKQISEREIKLLEKGFDMGELKFKSREELHER